MVTMPAPDTAMASIPGEFGSHALEHYVTGTSMRRAAKQTHSRIRAQLTKPRHMTWQSY